MSSHLSGAGAVILSHSTVTVRGSVRDEGRGGRGHVSVAAVPRVAIYLVEAAVSGERVVETRHAAVEAALLCTSVNHSIASERRRKEDKDPDYSKSHHLIE